MTTKIAHSFLVSLEWRIIAFFITEVFLWATTGHFWQATVLALLLQLILFVAYTFWYFFRQELHMPLLPGIARKQIEIKEKSA